MRKLLGKFAKSFAFNENGFTLIELLVVVSILGVLSSVSVPNVAKFRDSGNQAAVAANRAAVQTAVDAYAADSITNGGGGGAYSTVTADKLIPKYLRAAPSIGTYTISSTGAVTSVVTGTGTINYP